MDSWRVTRPTSRALLAPGNRYEDLFERALAWCMRAQQPFDMARTQLSFGERLRRMHRRRDARQQLCAAIDTFDSLGAHPWGDLARHELAGSVVRARQRNPTTRDDLTATERRVAQIVANGATNREAADRLFVTEKTVETHLTRIYRKLGLRSRTELARSPQLASLGSSDR